MKSQLFLLASLLLVSPLAAQEADGPVPMSGEAFGEGSGDRVLPGLGLVLELVDGSTAAPKLRLSGGLPGNDAAISTAFSSVEQVAGDLTSYLSPDAGTVHGSFDARGVFELSIAGWERIAASGLELYAQGAEAGVGFSTVHELSHGLRVFATPADEAFAGTTLDPTPEEGLFSITNPIANLPEADTLYVTQRVEELLSIDSLEDFLPPGLQGVLASLLERTGDKATLHLEGHISCAVVAVTNVGGALTLEVSIERLPNGVLELKTQRKVAVTGGVEAWQDTEAEAAVGLERVDVYHFSNLRGLERGLRGLVMNALVPDLLPFADISDLPLFQPVVIAQQALTVAHAALQAAQSLQSTFATASSKAWSNYVHASFPPIKAAYLAGWLATKAGYHAAKALVPTATEVLNAAGSVLSNLLRGANAIWQPIGYLEDHRVAYEMAGVVGAKLAASLAPVDLESLELGAEVEAEYRARLRVELPDSDAKPLAVELVLAIELEQEASVELGVGAKMEGKQELELSVRGELPSSTFGISDLGQISQDLLASFDTVVKASLTLDVLGSGVVAGAQAGVGREVKIELEQRDLVLDRFDDLCTLLSAGNGDNLVEALGETVVRLSVRDRIVAGTSFEAGASYAGYGLGIDEASFLWDEAGPAYEIETTVMEAASMLASCQPK